MDDQIRQQRWLVHLWLIISFILSLLTFPPHFSIPAHIFFGLLFAGLVVAHLRQRRRTVTILLSDFPRFGRWIKPRGRMAWADIVLVFLTLNVMVSGFADYFNHSRPVMVHLGLTNPLRWHAVSSIILLVLLLIHTFRRWKRLRTSQVR
jgi:hypothetical protein